MELHIITAAAALALLAALTLACSKDDKPTAPAEMPAEVLEHLSFENYRTETTKQNYGYHVFFEQYDAQQYDIWASGNAGAAMVNSKRTPEKFPTCATGDGYRGSAACLNTQSAGSLGSLVGKPIAAGNLFIGSFNKGKVMSDALKAAEFGVPVDREPVGVTGWYRYTPGPEFTDKNKKVIKDRTDEANIYGVFWDNTKAKVLYGDNALTSSAIVSKAQVASLPPAEDWAPFEMTFEGDAPDPEKLAARSYSFTLVFSSSKGGDSFEGAIESTLWVDEVEVHFK